MSSNALIPLYRLWFNTLIPQSYESRMTAQCTPVELRYTWLHSGYTTVDVMLEIRTAIITFYDFCCFRCVTGHVAN